MLHCWSCWSFCSFAMSVVETGVEDVQYHMVCRVVLDEVSVMYLFVLVHLALQLRQKTGSMLAHGNGLRRLISTLEGYRARSHHRSYAHCPGRGRRERRQHRVAQQSFDCGGVSSPSDRSVSYM